ncbi:MAG: transcriptional regulator [Sporomusa sp.]|nr:transcriptional regulator [Sporomusa sp.]
MVTDGQDKKVIGAKVLGARKEKGLTQLQVSEVSGLSRSYIADIEKGRYMPSVNALVELAKCLELDLSFLTLKT